MKALVLAAGLGERLRPLTYQTPKPLLPVGGRPLIHYPLAMLQRAGIVQVAVNVYHLAAQIQQALGDGIQMGLEISYAPEEVLLGTGGPLAGLRNYFGEQTFVVANADTILDLDLRAMIAFHRSRGALVTFALYRPANLDEYSRLEIDREGRVRRIRFRRAAGYDDFPAEIAPSVAADLRPFMFCGVYLCEPQVLDQPLPPPPFSSIRDLFAPLIARARPVFGYVHRGMFRTADDLAAYQALEREFAAAPPAI